MINKKTITGVIIAAILTGVLFVFLEKYLTKNPALNKPQFSPAKQSDLAPSAKPSLIDLPTPQTQASVINESTDLAKEAQSLQMRDYSSYFENLKTKVKE